MGLAEGRHCRANGQWGVLWYNQPRLIELDAMARNVLVCRRTRMRGLIGHFQRGNYRGLGLSGQEPPPDCVAVASRATASEGMGPTAPLGRRGSVSLPALTAL